MSKLLELVQGNKWEEALDVFSHMVEEGKLDEESCICGASIFEHFGQMEAMYDAICWGLNLNPKNYELYLILGNYYTEKNPDQAYLSYENALYFAQKQGESALEDAETIRAILEDYKNTKQISVRNVSFIILSYNTLEYTKLCIQSIRDTCKKGCYEIVVIDNASSDGSVQWLREQDDIVLQENTENAGFPGGCNQGIRLTDENNDIFLLNSDTLMMNNSLYQLRMGLYECERHGATGAVTNYAANRQEAYKEGKNIEDYYKYAYRNNIPCANPYEIKSMLIMFAMLIRRDVFNLVGELDERFNPGNYEDNDYGVRILEAGFLNILCWNSFIYHYGSKSFGKDASKYTQVIRRNRAAFKDKWGFAPHYYMYARNEIVGLVDADIDDEIRVLEVGCGLGDTLAAIKYKFPKAELHGIELVEKIAELGRRKFDIKCGNIENYEFSPEDKYDYIVLADVLEHLYDPNKILQKMKRQLKENGCILTSIPNVMNARVIYELLHGDFTYKDSGILDRTHIRFFTNNEIARMFENEGYEIESIVGTISPEESTKAYKDFFDTILTLVGEDKRIYFDVYQYVVRARVKG
jgi:GT2 family glycosyltransferase